MRHHSWKPCRAAMALYLAYSLMLLCSAATAEGVLASVVEGVPKELVCALLQAHPEAEALHVLAWQDNAPRHMSFAALTLWRYKDVVLDAREGLVPLEDVFVTSFAKGVYGPADSAWSHTCAPGASLAPGCQAPCPAPQALGLGSLTATLADAGTLTGPDEDAPQNSRVFYLCFFGREGAWSATAVSLLRRVEVSGAWYQPESYALYAVDRTIQ